MTCKEIQRDLSLYIDDQLPLDLRVSYDNHLKECPLCRHDLSLTRSIVNNLATMARPTPPANLVASINSAIAIEAAVLQKQPKISWSIQVIEWLRPHLMPYTVGAFASLLLFIAVFSALLPHFKILHDLEMAAYAEEQDATIAMLDGNDLYKLSTASGRGYAAGRTQFSIESPSLNPRGGLAAFETATHHGDTDDEMVVVADVFINGSAALADVVQAPRDPRLLEDLEKALRQSPAFVPAAVDKRPKTMRVVLAIQKVDIREQSF
jgi:hypothetical protein